MPRLSPAVQAARRDQIADAALTCIARDGIAGTSMADVIRESGLSAGSIYSHFESKVDVLHHAAQLMLERQAAATHDGADDSVTPSSLARRIVTALTSHAPRRAILQIWAEVARDPELTDVAAQTLGRIQEIQRTALLPWAEEHRSDPDEATELSRRAADAVIGAVHGFVVRTSVDASSDPDDLLTSMTAGLDHLHAVL